MRKLWMLGLVVLCGCGGRSASQTQGAMPGRLPSGSSAATSTAGGAETPEAYHEEIRSYREKRIARLTSDTCWLTVAGLFWLHQGDNSFGTDPKSDFVLPAGSAPEHAGVFVHHDSVTVVRAAAGVPLTSADKPVQELRLRADAEGDPTVVSLNDLRFLVIKRGARWAIRMRDLNSPMRREFQDIQVYPTDESYRVSARFEPYVPSKKIPIATIIGTVDTMASPGALVFELVGKTCRADLVLEVPGDTQLFLIFKDETSGEETYGAGRFLYTDLPKDGRVTVDFNKAYNPPCAFTPYATCPLPPPQNELPLAVRAGEKNYGHH